MNPVITCGSCGVKLRVKAAALSTKTEVTCTKCKSKIPIPEEVRANAGKPQAGGASAATSPQESVPKTGSITLACQSCGKNMIVRADLKGRKVRCGSCKEVTVVPDPDASEALSAETSSKPVSSESAEPSEGKPKEDKKKESPTPPPAETAAAPAEPEEPAASAAQPAAAADEKRIAALEEEVGTLKDQVATLTRLLTRYADSSSDATSILADALKEQAG